MTSARTSSLVQALTPAEGLPPLQWRTGIVRTINTAAVPHTVELDLGGVTIPAACYLSGHDLEVGAVVEVLVQEPKVLVLGPLAPARMVVAEHNHTTPPVNPAPPAAPPAAPSAPLSRTPKSVVADASATWVANFSNWRTDKVIQGGTGQRGFWFYGTKIATAKGAGTIVAATVFVRRSSSGGINGGANVRLGTHGHGSQPGSGSGALSNVAVVGTLTKGQGATFALTAGQVAALNAGAVGVGLEPGASGYTTADYLIADPRSEGDWSGALQLTVEG